ncbi:S8 family peptidase [Prosthecobacter algae]|uniref:S8 family peptidase n=1 Tax=Prosthecobacter algae TaxID=1144682 RepID=A0ABP9PFS6_9BACT
MNPELPPLPLSSPQTRRRRQQRQSFAKYIPIPAEQRRAIARRLIQEVTAVKEAIRTLSLEQRRAVILKLQHDRYLTSKDLAGTDLCFVGQPGDNESLVAPRDTELVKLGNRAQQLEDGENKAILQSPGVLTKVQKIEIADPKERLSDVFHQSYRDLITQEHVIYEIEVSSQAILKKSRTREVQDTISEIRRTLAGVHGAVYDCDFQEDGAKLMLWSTGEKLQELVEHGKWWRLITHFDLRPKFQTFKEVFEKFSVDKVSMSPPQETDETICVIDSGVAAGNPFLRAVVKADESRSWVYGASPTEDPYNHGSGVASLASYYNLAIDEGGSNVAEAWIVSARIMTDQGELDIPAHDDLAQDRRNQAWLLSNILREIVEKYQPKGVRIFVLAFQMIGHIWSRATRRQVARSAWIARTIDQLSREYDVIFCTITGNITASEAQELSDNNNTGYPKYLLHPLAKLHDPGPAVLAIASGSIANSAHIQGADYGIIAQIDQPSPFTRSGPGFGNSVKPDLVEYGGSLVQHLSSGFFAQNMGTNVVVASNQLTPALCRNHGTSFAAPRTAFHVAKILRDLKSLGIHPSNPLLRAFVASSVWDINIPDGIGANDVLALAGFGRPNSDRALLCEGHSVVLYWQGEVEADSTVIFKLHIPSEISIVGPTKKRITVTVASAPPVQKWGVTEYLGTELKFWLYEGDNSPDEIMAQHQLEEGEENVKPSQSMTPFQGISGINRRSVGALQRDVFEWNRHVESLSTNDYTLVVSVPIRARWMNSGLIPLAVVVRIEETSGQFVQLYSRIRERVRV